MILVLFTVIEKLPEERVEFYLENMPDDLQHSIRQLTRWEDQQASLIGKLLLLEGLNFFNKNRITLYDLQYTTSGRPFFHGDIDFNISHSGKVVVCAITDRIQVGIDIEEEKIIKLEEYKSELSATEWDLIQTNDDKQKAFYGLWTKKEAVAKAGGHGLLVPLPTIKIENEIAFSGDLCWYLKDLSLVPGYACCLAASDEITALKIQQVNFS